MDVQDTEAWEIYLKLCISEYSICVDFVVKINVFLLSWDNNQNLLKVPESQNEIFKLDFTSRVDMTS